MKSPSPLLPLVVCWFALAPGGASAAPAIETLDPAMAAVDADSGLAWYDALELGVEGRAWDGVEQPYDRLPAAADGVVTKNVWALSHCSAGLCIRFVSDSPRIAARWTLRSDRLAMNHMAATGVSGLDLYADDGGQWRWVGVGRPTAAANETTLMAGAPAGRHAYLLYLPLYNGVESLEIGVESGSMLAKAPPRSADRAKPIVVWGTSIVQGGCASRPGMAYPAILGRWLGRETVNLGFSGNGKMDPELAAMLAEVDAAVFVIDCVPNMTPELVTERAEPLVHTLRKAQPDTPIVLVENIVYQDGWFVAKRREAYEAKNAALEAAYGRLVSEGVTGLHYVPCGDLLGDDREATVDGAHATDLGFLRMAQTLRPLLERLTP